MNSKPVYRSKTLQEIIANQAKRIRELEARLKDKPTIYVTSRHIDSDHSGQEIIYLDALAFYVNVERKG